MAMIVNGLFCRYYNADIAHGSAMVRLAKRSGDGALAPKSHAAV